MRWEWRKGTHQIGYHDQGGKNANKPTLGKCEASATPIEFRDAPYRFGTTRGGDACCINLDRACKAMKLMGIQQWRDKHFTEDSAPDEVTVRRWLRLGTLPGRKVGGMWFIDEAE